ncbi:Gfo/Idh/MocA family protein [Chloroflexota bacterium]
MLVLVVGCGSIGERHIRNLTDLKMGEIIAHDVSPERRRELEKQYGISTFGNLDEALTRKPDVALICTPTSLHIPAALSVAHNSGCHLFIEKPLSHSLDDVDRLAEIVAQKNLVTLVGCNMRFHPSIVKIRELLEGRGIGKVLCARAQSGQYLPDWHPWEDYRGGYSANSLSGGGAILDGVHEIDYVSWFLGKVDQVFCFADKLSQLEIDTEDIAEILLHFESGAIAEVHLDYIQRSYGRSCHLIGEEGTILWDYNDRQVKLYSAQTKEWQIFPEEPDYDINQMYIEEIKHFIKCLDGKTKPAQDINAGRMVLEIALAAKESAKTRKLVNLEGH